MIIISLLALAIILSSASVLMNVAVINNIQIKEAPSQPSSGGVVLEVLDTPENTGGNLNGLG